MYDWKITQNLENFQSYICMTEKFPNFLKMPLKNYPVENLKILEIFQISKFSKFWKFFSHTNVWLKNYQKFEIFGNFSVCEKNITILYWKFSEILTFLEISQSYIYITEKFPKIRKKNYWKNTKSRKILVNFQYFFSNFW